MIEEENPKTIIDTCFSSFIDAWSMASDETNNLIYWINLLLTVVKLRIRYY